MTAKEVSVVEHVVKQFTLRGMSSMELRLALCQLGIDQVSFATMIGVSPRTVRGWIGVDSVPQVVANCLFAWIQLKDAGLPWNPLIPKD